MHTTPRIAWLARWLYLVAVVQFSALFAAVMPDSWADACAGFMGVEPLPHTPLAGYLARLSSMMYVVHGMTLAVVAKNITRSLFMVRPLGGITILLGCFMLAIDLTEGMPIIWTCIEFTALAANGIIMIALAYRAEESGAET
jgi:hypothetical protein